MHGAIGAEQRHLEQPSALAAPLQHRPKPATELLDGAEHIVFARDRLGKALLGHGHGNRQARRDWLLDKTERLIDPASPVPEGS